MSDKIQTASNGWVYWLTGIIVLLLMWWAAPNYLYNVKGVILPLNKYSAPISSTQVQLYSNNVIEQPVHFKPLAHINLEQHMTNKGSETANNVIATAKAWAAGIGADGIIVNLFGHTMSATPDSQRIYAFHGTAIKLKHSY